MTGKCLLVSFSLNVNGAQMEKASELPKMNDSALVDEIDLNPSSCTG